MGRRALLQAMFAGETDRGKRLLRDFISINSVRLQEKLDKFRTRGIVVGTQLAQALPPGFQLLVRTQPREATRMLMPL